MRYTHIAFDIDGTLIDSKYVCLQSLQDTMEAVTGVRPSKEELEFTYALTSWNALKELHVPDIPSAQRLWDKNYTKYEHSVAPFPGVPELLKELTARGCALGIITSQSRRDYEAGFAHFPIAAHFSTLIRSDDVPEPKPSPLSLLRYMELTGCSSDELLYIGDQEADLLCARDAGVDFALAGWGNPAAQWKVKYRFERPKDVLQYL